MLQSSSLTQGGPIHFPAWAELAVCTGWVSKRLVLLMPFKTICPLRTSMGGQFSTQSQVLEFRYVHFSLPAHTSLVLAKNLSVQWQYRQLFSGTQKRMINLMF